MLALAGMRPGELENGELNGERMVVIDHEEDSTWRPKTYSSYRRVFNLQASSVLKQQPELEETIFANLSQTKM